MDEPVRRGQHNCANFEKALYPTGVAQVGLFHWFLIRRHHAAKISAQHNSNVTEVTYQVGFNNLSYFAKSFHEQFGVTPHTYVTRSSNIPPDGEENPTEM
jgi:AraC-like DNA-binding protein